MNGYFCFIVFLHFLLHPVDSSLPKQSGQRLSIGFYCPSAEYFDLKPKAVVDHPFLSIIMDTLPKPPDFTQSPSCLNKEDAILWNRVFNNALPSGSDVHADELLHRRVRRMLHQKYMFETGTLIDLKAFLGLNIGDNLYPQGRNIKNCANSDLLHECYRFRFFHPSTSKALIEAFVQGVAELPALNGDSPLDVEGMLFYLNFQSMLKNSHIQVHGTLTQPRLSTLHMDSKAMQMAKVYAIFHEKFEIETKLTVDFFKWSQCRSSSPVVDKLLRTPDFSLARLSEFDLMQMVLYQNRCWFFTSEREMSDRLPAFESVMSEAGTCPASFHWDDHAGMIKYQQFSHFVDQYHILKAEYLCIRAVFIETLRRKWRDETGLENGISDSDIVCAVSEHGDCQFNIQRLIANQFAALTCAPQAFLADIQYRIFYFANSEERDALLPVFYEYMNTADATLVAGNYAKFKVLVNQHRAQFDLKTIRDRIRTYFLAKCIFEADCEANSTQILWDLSYFHGPTGQVFAGISDAEVDAYGLDELYGLMQMRDRGRFFKSIAEKESLMNSFAQHMSSAWHLPVHWTSIDFAGRDLLKEFDMVVRAARDSEAGCTTPSWDDFMNFLSPSPECQEPALKDPVGSSLPNPNNSLLSSSNLVPLPCLFLSIGGETFPSSGFCSIQPVEAKPKRRTEGEAREMLKKTRPSSK